VGCDIHYMIEVRGKKDPTKWRLAFSASKLYDMVDKGELFDYDQIYRHPLYLDRDYTLFAVLAGVRSWVNAFSPISRPKGIPPDASPGYNAMCEKWRGDGHSHSWLTIKEIQDYDFSKVHRVLSDEPPRLQYFQENFIPSALKFGKPENVRICFFFDN